MYLNNGNGLGFRTEYVRGESRDTTQLYAVRESPDSYQPLCVTCSLQQHRRNQVSVYFCCSITQKIPLKVHNGELYFLCRKDWILRTSTQSRVIKMSVLYAVETHFYLKRWKKQNTQYSVCWFQKSKLKGNIWNFDTLWSWNICSRDYFKCLPELRNPSVCAEASVHSWSSSYLWNAQQQSSWLRECKAQKKIRMKGKRKAI